MNRLILVGNGFDLAHGRKTTFGDFILDYLVKAIDIFKEKRVYEDELISIYLQKEYVNHSPFEKIVLTKENVVEEIRKFKQESHVNKFEFKSVFFQQIIGKLIRFRWVDIEMEYFNFIKNLKLNNQVKVVNDEFDILKSKLIAYLKREQINIKPFKTNKLVDCFTEKIAESEVISWDENSSTDLENLYFLNFNYTPTIEKYAEICKKYNPIINYIHGSLCGEYGDPIFGFGDELDETFKEFEKRNDNEFFRHIKSFEYMKTSNYYSLVRFINSGFFQVHIYGHSCGLSDRTMLNQIFDNDKCVSVKLFYHEKEDGQNDFTEKTYEIYRHFENKQSVRNKIVPFVKSRAMPQPR